jgi:phosphoglycolate phosphatase-like HAD superfamily hydrolase
MAKNALLATDAASVETLHEMRQTAKYWNDAVKEQVDSYQGWNEMVDGIGNHTYSGDRLAGSEREREMQIAWANSEVIKPTVYSRAPTPAVIARHKDKRPLIKHTAEMMERALMTSFDMEDIHSALLLVTDQLVDCSRGVLWLDKAADTMGREKINYSMVDRSDFVHSPARNWPEVWWVARRRYYDEIDFVDMFGEDKLKEVQFEQREWGDNDEEEGDPETEVWEVWSRIDGKRAFIHEECEDFLLVEDPPFDVRDFFPCPKPAYGTTEMGSLRPIPHFLYIKDQIEEIDELTARISALSEALRLRGFYAAGVENVSETIERLIEDQDNRATLVPVPSTMLVSGQPLSQTIMWLPVDMVATVIASCVELRKQLIQDVYEVTGISDIMRGATDAQETLGAQQLKGEYGSVRIKKLQAEMVRIAKDAAVIAAEIMAETFDPEMLLSMSQYHEIITAEQRKQQIMVLQQQIEKAQQSPQMQQMQQQNPEQAQQQAQQIVMQVQKQIDDLMRSPVLEDVIAVLQSERLRPFVIDIETDSTILPNENENKRRTNEFLTALGSALQQLAPMVAADPSTSEFAGQVLKFAVQPYRAGRELEAAIDDLIDSTKEKQQQPPQPNPQEEIIKMEQQARIRDAQAKEKEAELRIEKLKYDEQNDQRKTAEAQTKEQAKAAADVAKYREERELEERKLALMEQENSRKAENDAMKLQVELAKLTSQENADMEVVTRLREELAAMISQANVDPAMGAKIIDAATPKEPAPDPVMLALEQLTAGQASLADGLNNMASAMQSPKRVVRDADGSPIGIETLN